MDIDKEKLETALEAARDAREKYWDAAAKVENILGSHCDELDLTTEDMVSADGEWLIDLVNGEFTHDDK